MPTHAGDVHMTELRDFVLGRIGEPMLADGKHSFVGCFKNPPSLSPFGNVGDGFRLGEQTGSGLGHERCHPVIGTEMTAQTVVLDDKKAHTIVVEAVGGKSPRIRYDGHTRFSAKP